MATPEELAASAEERRSRSDAALRDMFSTLGEAMGARSVFRKLSLLSVVGWTRLLGQHEAVHRSLVAGLLPPDFENEDVAARVDGLMFALPYAKAVYGHPMLKGHMRSIGAAVQSKISLVGFDALETPDARTNIEAMCAICGRSTADVLHAHFDASPLRPAHAVLVDHEAATVVLTIRGTLCPEDALTDVMMSITSDGEVGGGEASFHVGILQAAKWMAGQVRPSLEAAARQHPAYRLAIVGHSLGAGVGAILALALDQGAWLDDQPSTGSAMDLQSFVADDESQISSAANKASLGNAGFGVPCAGFSSVHCYAFACPSIASEGVSASHRALRVVTMVICEWDMIVRTCAKNIDSLLHEVSMNSIHTQLIDAAGSLLGGKVQEYAEDRRRDDTGQSLPAPRHYPIGYCLLIAHPQRPDACLLHAAPQQFGRIMVHPNMLSDHMMSQYEVGLTTASHAQGFARHTTCSLKENQRFFVGRSWMPSAPGLIFTSDPSEWITVAGVAAEAPPVGAGWVPAVSEGTDAEGWMYATAFERMPIERDGGRAQARPTDVVRQRSWLQRPPEMSALLEGSASSSAG